MMIRFLRRTPRRRWTVGMAESASTSSPARHACYRSRLSRCRACRSIQTIARHDPQRIHVTVPGSNADPRSGTSLPPHVQIHRTPPLHPDDVVTLPSGLRVTSVARTLIDLAEVLTADELREAFIAARARGLLDVEEVRRSRA